MTRQSKEHERPVLDRANARVSPNPGVAATVTKHAPTSPADTKRKFLASVLPWPGPSDRGFINLHVNRKNDTAKNAGKPWVIGWPFDDIDKFVDRSLWIDTTSDMFNVWMCMSQQSECGTNTNGKPKAIRNAKNATWLRSIWIDCDVKEKPASWDAEHPREPWTHYETEREALSAFGDFAAKVGLPMPSAIVHSGGGLHVYWISETPLSPNQWSAYAEGLKSLLVSEGVKCDAGLTTDAARLLRVPGTLNHKYDPPRPVRLVHLGQMYNFETALAVVRGVAPKKFTAAPSPSLASVIEPGYESAFENGPDPAFASLKAAGDLAAGIARRIQVPRDPGPVFDKCAFLGDALKNGGKDYNQPLWHLSVLCATFLENGNDIAHEISKEHPTYTEADTQEMYERKLADRAERGIGWPSCATIHGAGCKACASCPFLSNGKSPLHLTGPISATVNPSATAAGEPPQHVATQKPKHPNAALKDMVDRGALLSDVLKAMNEIYAVVKYGDHAVIANVIGRHISFMSVPEFHKMLANQRIEIIVGNEVKQVKVSHHWFNWKFRRQYIGQGAVFEPGGPLEVPGDMLNIYRGFGIEPAPGDWSLMRAHILHVICSGRQDLFDYLIRWMAWSVQKLDQPIGVAVALLGEQGAGKGIFARTFGSFFGDHFAHIANGDQLTGRFNASVGKSCFVFLDEAVWAGDKKGEGVLKALITEPTLQLEAKFKDPITVKNSLRIMVASNSEWAVPAGIGDRRWLILNINNRYAGTKNAAYFSALKHEIDNGAAAAMLHDLLRMDLSGFNVRDVPRTAAKAEQQALSLPSVEAWVYQMLQEGVIEERLYQGICIRHEWQANGLDVKKDIAYAAYEDFSHRRKDYRPATKSIWARRLMALLGPHLRPVRHAAERGRVRSFLFGDLSACRDQFAAKIGADFEWEPYQVTEAANDVPSGTPAVAEPKTQPSNVVAIAKDIDAAERFIANRRAK
jgi:hypothetical protein